MDKIEVKVLNPEVIQDAEKMMVAMARLTQAGHKVKNMNDFMDLFEKSYKQSTAKTMVELPHPTIQRFAKINVAVVGASRRFLAQITRHQHDVTFMSASLQYSNYSDDADFVVPYEVFEYDAKYPELKQYARRQYLNSCACAMTDYMKSVQYIGHDAAGYMAPQGLRNVLLISASPFELKHMIQQRICNRNTIETQYVMLKIWEALYNETELFKNAGPTCIDDDCKEGRFGCGTPLYVYGMTPTEILDSKFSLIRGGNA